VLGPAPDSLPGKDAWRSEISFGPCGEIVDCIVYARAQ
jgi:hypothetical protein